MKGAKTVFTCGECGYQSIKWLGRCPGCSSWNTFDEEVVFEKREVGFSKNLTNNRAEKFSELALPTYIRTKTGMGELDRVLGGGIII